MNVIIEVVVILFLLGLVFSGIILLCMPIFCIFDTLKFERKRVWILFVILIPIVGWVVYFIVNKPNIKDYWNGIFYGIVLFAALSSIIFLFAIIFSIFIQGANIFGEYGILKFVFGTHWYPTYEPPDFGILPIILGSFLITLITIIIAVFFGVGSAIYISEIAKPNEKEILKPFIEILAGIPSVIYGLFGMAFLAPAVQKLFHLKTGFNAFTAGIILGIMVIPIISSISEDAINSVPRHLREASLALGANKWETIMKVVVPAAKSGIITAVILGVGRAIGETMVVLMVAGNSAIIPTSIFDSVRPMTSTIAAEMGETPVGSLHYNALFGIGIVLFIITFLLNIFTEFIREGVRKQHAAR